MGFMLINNELILITVHLPATDTGGRFQMFPVWKHVKKNVKCPGKETHKERNSVSYRVNPTAPGFPTCSAEFPVYMYDENFHYAYLFMVDLTMLS
jgi:hypothetical protein